jgi:hypothetical protein
MTNTTRAIQNYSPKCYDLVTSLAAHQLSLTTDTHYNSSSTVSKTPWNTRSFLYNEMKQDTKATNESKAHHLSIATCRRDLSHHSENVSP